MLGSKIKITDSDIRIIQELRCDATQSSDQLAKKLGMASSTIRRKVAALIKSGAIRSIVVPHPDVIGYGGWALLGISVTPELVNAVTDELASFDAIYTIASSFGRFDIIALVQCASADELQSFIRDELPKVSGIKGIETFILMRPRKYHGVVWRAGNKV
ncbi:hypothetical protein ES704_03997 [subsurface metagenome]